MKKLKKLLLCCVMGIAVLSFAACGNDNKTDKNDNANNDKANNTEAGNSAGNNAADDASDAVENTGDDIMDWGRRHWT